MSSRHQVSRTRANHRIATIAAAAVLAAASWSAAQSTWANSGTDYNTAANWTNNTVPTVTAVFVGAPAAQPNISVTSTLTSLDFRSASWNLSGLRLSLNISDGGIVSTGAP